jgi:ABC-type Na+ efflux pump permease subunit
VKGFYTIDFNQVLTFQLIFLLFSLTESPKKQSAKKLTKSAKKSTESTKKDSPKKPKWKGYVLIEDNEEEPVEAAEEEVSDVKTRRAKRQRHG